MASDARLRHRQSAAAVVADARTALLSDGGIDRRRWTYLALLEAVAMEAIALAGLDASLTFVWDEHAPTYTRQVMVHASDAEDRVLRTAYIVEPDPSRGSGMTRVWMGGAALPYPASRMMDAEVPSWMNANAVACSAP